MNIPFLDLHRQYTGIKSEIDEAVKRVIEKQYFILGEEIDSLEKEFAEYLGVNHVLGVGSGTDALILALRALNIGKGDEVITQPNSFIATTLAITELGAKPVFVDVDPNTYQIDIDQIQSKITKNTKAILPVHLYGAPCDIEKIMQIAKKNHLYVVEDACQAHGATIAGKKTGTFGDIGTYSFYPGKNMGAYGDGGALCTNNKAIYEKLLRLRNYGQSKKYFHDEIGLNSRLDEIQAAVLRVKLKYLDKWNKKRNEVAQKYIKGLVTNFKCQKILEKGISNYHVYIIETNKRDQLMTHLKDKGVNTLIHYPVPIHLQNCYKYLGYKKGEFPISEGLATQILSLPIYPELKSEELTYIVSLIKTFYA